ncbi:hypothetical protein OHC33_006221 [Knufia fluminis]|uniref:Cytochrome P450 n=1 Tax=Knufia fluminis TaxID=191047 RepID=A0AAN8ECY8_9EURO|nr:hypothetical protein OHC33_006221 [Knufia fluminis]
MRYQVPFVPLLCAAAATGLLVAKIFDSAPYTVLSSSLGVGLAAYTLYTSYVYPFYVSQLRHIPTVPGCPLWGHFFAIITSECGIPAREWHANYGGVVRYFFPFSAERLSIADDEAIKQMTVKNPYNYPKPARARAWMRPVLGDGVLLAEGHVHVQQRKALTPAFSISSIRSLMPVFWEKALHMANLWEVEMKRASHETKSFEVLEWLNRATLDIIGKAGLGTEINSLDNPETLLRQAYKACFDFSLQARIINSLAAFTQLVRLVPSKTNRDIAFARDTILTRATTIIHQKQVEAAEKKDSKTKDIIGLIVKDNMTASAEDSLTIEAMRDQVMTFLGAGHDTTATSVAWTLMLLSKHPAVQHRLRQEIKEYMPFLFDDAKRFDGDEVTKADVDLLPYVEHVCKEALRFIPSIPMTVRQAREDDYMAGYYIPAGTTVYLMANAINRLESYWGATANQFDPDRWRKLPPTYTTNAFMTFLQGPRGCIGRKFAEVEMKALLCSLLSKFTFELDATFPDPEELKMWRLVLRPRDGVNLIVRPLKS